MNKTLRNIILSISIFFILWFIIYFYLGEYIDLEFSNPNFSKTFPKILTFLCAVSIYTLFLISIRRAYGWSFLNILKFIVGILFSLIPIFLFEFFSLSKCANWKIDKSYKKTLYESKISSSESIKLIELECKETNTISRKVERIMQITPLFISTSKIDTLKISDKNWKKL
ncbi:hypothetical protein [Chishuiella sp.]|uniref:hypothetical protein n=1 Tax=Chishuiella sp. TaxID=1969467 RepID=UPI0028A9639C|nr:hypothetical protein [Chishuiella sp.]